ncbi:MAG TPA: outer membrane beta-barrel protein [Acidobacteriota bacterium]|nr:outer membrane beta-barrel protein [Acidobacteriota bacterium]
MKKLVLIAVFLLGFSMMALAADAPAIEVFGGYSFVRVDTTTAFTVPNNSFDLNMNGWRGSITFNGNKWAGFVADFNGVYGSVEDVSVRNYSIMFGPKITLHRGTFAPFFQALFGYSRTTADSEDVKENDFAMAFGGGLDVNLNNRLAVRPFQVEYYGVKAGLTGAFSANLRYSAGVVFKLGKR